MENEQLNEFTPLEHYHQIRSYFDIIDNAIQVGDTNRRYVPSKDPASPKDINDNSYTTFNISPKGENMIDLYNTNLLFTYKGTYKLATKVDASTIPNTNNPAIWLGCDDSIYFAGSYQILANGRSVYSTDNAIFEAYVISNCETTETVKKVDVFSKTRHADVWKRVNTVRSGQVVDCGGKVANSEINVEIPLKLPVRKFLPFAAIRFLLDLAGNIQIKVKFTSDALQVCPLSVEDCLITPNNVAKVKTYPKLTNHFVPWSQEFTMITSVTQDSSTKEITITTGKQKLTKVKAQFTDCAVLGKNFSLDPNVYAELVEHYTNQALCFPIKLMDWMPMDGTISDKAGSKCTFTREYTPINVNSIWFLFQKTPEYLTNFENPLFNDVQLFMGAYGTIPSEPESTNSPAYYEIVSNACNTNNDMIGFNVDVMKSLTTLANEDTGYVSNDTTHFLMGFPTETDFTFQQGQASNSPITYKLTVTTSQANTPFKEKPQIGFLRHCCFAIQARANGPPDIKIDDYNLAAEAE